MVRLTPSADPRYPDDETRKIVEDLEKKGIKSHVPKDGEAPVEDTDEDDEELTPEQKAEKEAADKAAADAKAEEEAKAKEEADAKAKADAEAAANADDADKSKKKEDGDGKPRRQVLIPVARVKQNEARIKAEFEGKISELTNQVTTLQKQIAEGGTQAQEDAQKAQVEKLTKMASDIATAHDTDPAVILEILKAATYLQKAGVDLPKELTESVATLTADKAKRDEEAETLGILTAFDDEFAESIGNDAKLKEDIRASGLTMEQFKERLQEIVLGEDGEKYAKLTLPEVLALKRADLLPKKAKTADGVRQRTATGASDTDDNREPTAEEIRQMVADGTFEAYSEKRAKASKSHITRGGRPI